MYDKKFVNSLRIKFIALLGSQRGLQAKLSKSIEKSSSYFSEIKRGNPVNALHLKAVEIVLGPEKVIELLDINNVSNGPSLVRSQNLIEKFKDPIKIQNIIKDLLRLEGIDLEGFEEIHRIIKVKLEMKQDLIEKQKGERKKIS